MFAEGHIASVNPLKTPGLVVPKSAVMWTGTRSVVYVSVPERPMPTFEFREVVLGPDIGTAYLVQSGLRQLAGKKSMMNKAGGEVVTGHQH
jgi:Cu(I)/Ag(I) efflux system membrane fusion protein